MPPCLRHISNPIHTATYNAFIPSKRSFFNFSPSLTSLSWFLSGFLLHHCHTLSSLSIVSSSSATFPRSSSSFNTFLQSSSSTTFPSPPPPTTFPLKLILEPPLPPLYSFFSSLSSFFSSFPLFLLSFFFIFLLFFFFLFLFSASFSTTSSISTFSDSRAADTLDSSRGAAGC